MSAFYALAYADRIELLTDGAVYRDDGTLTDIRRKVFTSDTLPIAIAGRGSIAVLEAMATVWLWRASLCGTVDEAIAAFQGALDRRSGKGLPSDIEMVICALSEADGPMVLYFATADIYGNGTPPWMLVDVSPEFGAGARFEPEELAGLDASDGLAGVAMPMFEAMRQHKDINPARPDLPPQYGVGGHVDLTVVRTEGCTVERTHVWPEDVVGRKIEPFRGELAEAA